jgi:hypothetical protein
MFNLKFKTMKKKIFRVRFEELPALGEFVEASFLRDKELFAAFSPVYANGFAEEFHSKLTAVKTAELPHILTSNMKDATEIQYTSQATMLKLVRIIERYWELNDNPLPVRFEMLGTSELKKNLRKHDAEAVVLKAKALLQALQTCQPVLQEKGLAAEQIDEFKKLIDVIEKNNAEQNALLNQRRSMVDGKINLWNDFWDLLRNVMKTGRLIHEDNPVRKAEYSEKNLISRVRQVYLPEKKKVEEAPPEPEKKAEPVAS